MATELDRLSALDERDRGHPEAGRLDHEVRVAWWLVLAVLATLTIVKPLGSIPVVGTIGFTLAAAMQLYLPLWRADRLRLGYDVFGLHLKTWRKDLKIVLVLAAVTLPPFAFGHHLYMTQMHGWAVRWFPAVAQFFPERRLVWLAGGDGRSSLRMLAWLGQIVATHTLGVALPEETFYRGYLLPLLQRRWSPRARWFGVAVGKAAVISAALFAAGHFLGEWNPLRFGPFFPALVFSWQRNATGSIAGAIGYHALCNIFGEILFAFYAPI